MSMAPILFSDAATNYSTHGIGSLADALSCYVTEELNGQYELEMTYPVTGRRYKDIKNRCLIYCKPDPYRAGQPFRIYRITKPLNGIVTIYAQHISYDLAGIPVRGFTAQSLSGALAGLVSNAIVSNPFTFWTDISSSTQFSFSAPAKCRSLLGGSEGSILDTYGGEYEWDMMTVRLRSHRGQNNGVRIAYGKNLTDITQDENISNLVTGIVGYWTNSDGVVVEGPVVNAPGTYNFSRVIPVDFSGEFEDQPTPQQLQQISQEYISSNGVGIPEVSINVSWVQLEQYSGYEQLNLLERVTLGDTVTVEFPELGVDATARVEKTKYNALLNRYESADIGGVQANIADTIANQQGQIQKKPDLTTVQQIANAIADAITGAKGGSVRLLDTNGDGEPDTLYIADNPDPAQAVKVWRFNYAGWGASSNGYNGPFEMSAALGLGLYADFITVGTLTAIRIQSADGRSSWDLASGSSIFNSNSIVINSTNFQLDANGNCTATGTFSTVSGNLQSTVRDGGFYSYINGQLAAAIYGYSENGQYMGAMRCFGQANSGGMDDFAVLRAGLAGGEFALTDADGNQNCQITNGVIIANGLGISGTKNRIVSTSFGRVKMHALESPTPCFMDFGTGICGENGLCLLTIDPRVLETLMQYQLPIWTVTPNAPGQLWVEPGWTATVHGEPGQAFSWTVTAPQVDYGDQYADLWDGIDIPSPAAVGGILHELEDGAQDCSTKAVDALQEVETFIREEDLKRESVLLEVHA